MNMLYITPLPKEKRIGWLLFLPAIVLPLIFPSDNLLLKGCYYLALLIATVLTFRTFLTDSIQSYTGSLFSFLWKTVLMFVVAELVTTVMNDGFLLLQIRGFVWGENGPFFLSNYDLYWLDVFSQGPWVAMILLVLILPVIYTILVHGLFFNTLYQKYPALAFFLTTVLFALIHTLPYIEHYSLVQTLVLFMQYVPTALILSFAYCMTESIYSPMLIHIAIKAYIIYFYW